MRLPWLQLSLVASSMLSLRAAQVRAEPDDKTAAVQPDRLGEEGELRRAISLYDSGQYDACVDAFQELLEPEGARRLRSPSKIESAGVYYGSCLIGVGRTLEAEAVFRRAILDNPQMKTPDSLLFPEAVVELFLRVRESMMDEIRRAEQKRMQDAEARASREIDLRQREMVRVEQLMKLAENETVIERHTRWLTLVPFGTGQFQNGNRGLGWFFLASETAVTSLFISSMYLSAWYSSKNVDGVPSERRRELSAARENAYLVGTFSGWGLFGLLTAGLVEANVTFVPETKLVRPRQLPKELRQLGPGKRPGPALSLTIAPLSCGGWTGSVIGSF